jgi:hypothetical protein
MSPHDEAVGRLRLALDLFAAGEEMMRQRLRHEHPELSDPEIEERLRAWFQQRPGAEFGDSPGRALPWPRPAP